MSLYALAIRAVAGLPMSDDVLTFAGMYGQSTIREVDLASGRVLREKQMAALDFGEGLVKVRDR